jgi:hypothetical protein
MALVCSYAPIYAICKGFYRSRQLPVVRQCSHILQAAMRECSASEHSVQIFPSPFRHWAALHPDQGEQAAGSSVEASVKRGFSDEDAIDDSDRPLDRGGHGSSAQPSGPDFRTAAVRATEHLALRRQRGVLFGGDLFGEGSWDILLELMIAKFKGTRMSVKNACSLSGVPTTTALRCLDKLEARGFVHRRHHETGKREWLELEASTCHKLVTLLLTANEDMIL